MLKHRLRFAGTLSAGALALACTMAPPAAPPSGSAEGVAAIQVTTGGSTAAVQPAATVALPTVGNGSRLMMVIEWPAARRVAYIPDATRSITIRAGLTQAALEASTGTTVVRGENERTSTVLVPDESEEGLPPGTYIVKAEAHDASGKLLATGMGSATVRSHEIANITLTLSSVNKSSGGSSSNSAPAPAPTPTPTPTPHTPGTTIVPSARPSGQLGTFTSVGNLAYPVAAAAVVKVRNRVYLLGGTTDWSSVTSRIQSATLDAAGDIGAFAESAGTLAEARSGATAEVIGDYLYVFGGTRDEASLSSVERASINADGTLGNFEVLAGVQLATGRQDFVTYYTGTYVYAVGGAIAGGTATADVERAEVLASGELGAFASVADVALSTPRWAFTSARVGDYLYVIGGGNPGALNSIDRARITADGTLENFSTVANGLSAARNRLTAVALASKLYVFGGRGDELSSAVDAASIESDASLGEFAPEASSTLAVPTEHGAGLLTPNAVYYFGGRAVDVESTIQKAPIE